MSIAADRFAAEGMFPTIDPYNPGSPPVSVFFLQCRCCGFEVDNVAEMPRSRCPKCQSQGWERIIRPGSALRVMDPDRSDMAEARGSRSFVGHQGRMLPLAPEGQGEVARLGSRAPRRIPA
jgi:hypothetical protein